jgi:hypothetical protein
MEIQEVILKVKEMTDSKQGSNDGNSLSSIIKIKPYLPLMIKREIIKSVTNMSLYVDDETEMLKCDDTLRELFYVLSVVLELTDIEIDDLYEEDVINVEKAIETYDLIVSNGIFEYVLDQTPTWDLDNMIDREIKQQIKIYNSTANVLRKSINSLLSKIPNELDMKTLMEQLPAQLESLSELEILGGVGKKSKGRKKSSNNSIK